MIGWKVFNIFQSKEFAEIYCRHRNLDLINIQDSNIFIFKAPIISYLKMRVYLSDSSNINSLLDESLKLCKIKNIPTLEIITSYNDNSLHQNYKVRVGTYVIDVTSDIDMLWQKLRQQNRTQIRYSQKNGVIVKQAETLEDFKEWWHVYKETAKRGRFIVQKYALAEELFRKHHLCRLFVATINNKIVAGLFILTYKAPFYWIGGSLPEYWQFRPNNLLHWEVIKWAHENGYLYYDMGGANPINMQGATLFKKQFGGEYREGYKYIIQMNLFKSKLVNLMSEFIYTVNKKTF